MVTHIHCCLMADRGWTAVVINMFCTSPTAEAQYKTYSWNRNSHWIRTILSPLPVPLGYKQPDDLKSSCVSDTKFFLYHFSICPNQFTLPEVGGIAFFENRTFNYYKVQNPNNHYLIFHGCPLSPIWCWGGTLKQIMAASFQDLL